MFGACPRRTRMKSAMVNIRPKNLWRWLRDVFAQAPMKTISYLIRFQDQQRPESLHSSLAVGLLDVRWRTSTCRLPLGAYPVPLARTFQPNQRKTYFGAIRRNREAKDTCWS